MFVQIAHVKGCRIFQGVFLLFRCSIAIITVVTVSVVFALLVLLLGCQHKHPSFWAVEEAPYLTQIIRTRLVEPINSTSHR